MDISHLVAPLNDAQRQAVTAPAGAALVVAGAGSGKTRVLTHRVAWLVEVEQVTPQCILAVTFTNKAAGEMRARIEQLLQLPAAPLWIGTFHGIAHRLLRLHWQAANLPQNFQIIDADDQQRLLRKLIKSSGLNEEDWDAKRVAWFINAQKDEGLRPAQVRDRGELKQREMITLFAAYQQHCDRAGLIDFAELLLRAHELWRTHPELLTQYQQRFQHILVDEFQDTNTIQYLWLKALVGQTGHPFVVGDDDQSIYGWRGANSEHLKQFQRDFPGAHVFRLEQNYRSTGHILSAANALIENNHGRVGKNLWTQAGHGERIKLYAAINERDEGEFVVGRIRAWLAQGGKRGECAILFRSNAQSRVLEEAMMIARLPYRVYGGLRFFERAEIKDALAYLRLVYSRSDDASFDRVVNLPTRGIGLKTLESVRQYARDHACSLWTASIETLSTLSARAALNLQQFIDLIERLAADTKLLPLHEQVDHIITHSGLQAHYQTQAHRAGVEARMENLAELVSAAHAFSIKEQSVHSHDLDLSPLAAFITHAVLESGDTQANEWEDSVQLMTLHTAKGLEFPVVFIVGLEDGLFPHQRALMSGNDVQEERRLCYVGITRARRQLYLTFAENRRLHGTDGRRSPSRFIHELPTECIEEVRPRIHVSQPVYTSTYKTQSVARFDEPETDGMRLGQRVRHSTFGEGVVLDLEGQGVHTRVQVRFEQRGSKWLMLSHANLETV